MPARVTSGLHASEIRTVKHCPPFLDAMAYGFVVRLPCDVHVDRGVFSWNWPVPAPRTPGHPRGPLSFHSAAQLEGTPFASGHSAIKFNSFWTIELESGWSLLAMHPANREDLPFRLLTGLVDADLFHDVGVFFPAIWSDAEFRGVLPRGLPVAQCLPVPRVDLELDCAPLSAAGSEAYATLAHDILGQPGVYRRRFRARRAKVQD
jgi:hypothetical protein